MIMERPELSDYKTEIHHPNGAIEDIWDHNKYVEDLEKYCDILESKSENLPKSDDGESQECEVLKEKSEDYINSGIDWNAHKNGVINYSYQSENARGIVEQFASDSFHSGWMAAKEYFKTNK